MGNSLQQSDFYYSYTDEPHSSRRKEILLKYPQIKELYGYDPKTKYLTVFWVLIQFVAAYLVRNSSWWMIIFAAYIFGAVSNHALFLAMHEISHNLAFSSPLYNRLLGCFANITTVVPHFSMFQRYHMDHHQFQGVTSMDTDVPSYYEGRIITNLIKKFFWVGLQPFFYIIRPILTKPKKPGFWEAINWSIVLFVDILVLYTLGLKSLIYFLLSGLLSASHAVGGHFIAEHYVWIKDQETYSYYGPLNLITFNVGYHNEHHDFPRIPGSRLPKLRSIAPEYYNNLPCHSSWSKVIFDFIVDPTVGPFSRIVRSPSKSQ